MKRGAIQSMFAWILMIIIGSVFILFFVAFISNQRAASDARIGSSLINHVDTVLTTTKVAPNAFADIEIPKAKFEFVCEEDLSLYQLYGKGINKETPFDVIFSPDILEGRHLLAFTRDWHVPFKVMNFLYVTNDAVAYYFFDDLDNAGMIEDMYGYVHDNVTKEIINVGQQPVNNNYDKIRIIYYQEYAGEEYPLIMFPEGEIRELKDRQVTAVVIRQVQEMTDAHLYGQVLFYEKEGNTWQEKGSSSYFTTPMLLGAIFSENKEMYECNVRKAFKALQMQAWMQYDRIARIQSQYDDEGNFCGALLDPCLFMDDEDYGAENDFDVPDCIGNSYHDFADEGPTTDTVAGLYEHYRFVIAMNTDLLRGNCAVIY